MLDINTRLIDNIRVLKITDSAFPSGTLLILVNVGSRDEADASAGIAHFLEHIVFKGTHNYPNFLDVSLAAERLGGVINAFTSYEYTGFWIKLNSDYYHQGFDIIRDLVSRPLIKPEAVDKERGVIIEELKMYNDQPRSKVEELFLANLFPALPLGRPIIGRLASLKQINSNKLKRFRRKWYTKDNMIVVVSGDNWKQAETEVRHLSQLLESQTKSKLTHQRSYTYTPPKQSRVIQSKDLDQVYLCYGGVCPGLTNKKDMLTMVLLDIILGQDMSSRLMRKVREEQGLAYFVYNSHQFHTDTGYFATYAGVRQTKLDQALEIITTEYEGIRTRKPGYQLTQSELDLAKIKYKGRLLLSMEDSSNRAVFFGRQLLLESTIITIPEMFKLIDDINLNDLNRLAEIVFEPKRLVLSLLGQVNN